MNLNARIYVAGHRGMVGSALVRNLIARGYKNIITRSHAELDLTNQAEVDTFFVTEHPEHVFLAAAKVGGIYANNEYPAEFIFENLAIQTNVIDAAYRHNVKRLLSLGSSCIYPKMAPQPMKEEYLLTGSLEPTNRPYAIAKIAAIEMCWSYNRQYGTHFLAAMPTNLYGPGDNYHPQNSHVVPALIRKFHEAKHSQDPQVTVWGTRTPRREFLFSDDMADACCFLMNLSDTGFKSLLTPLSAPLVNIGMGKDISIQKLAETVREVVSYSGDIVFDKDMPDGAPRKLLDISLMQSLGWKASTSLDEGLNLAYLDYVELDGPPPTVTVANNSR